MPGKWFKKNRNLLHFDRSFLKVVLTGKSTILTGLLLFVDVAAIGRVVMFANLSDSCQGNVAVLVPCSVWMCVLWQTHPNCLQVGKRSGYTSKHILCSFWSYLFSFICTAFIVTVNCNNYSACYVVFTHLLLENLFIYLFFERTHVGLRQIYPVTLTIKATVYKHRTLLLWKAKWASYLPLSIFFNLFFCSDLSYSMWSFEGTKI